MNLQEIIDDAKALHGAIHAGVEELSKIKEADAGPLIVARGTIATALQQLSRHAATVAPAPAANAPAPVADKQQLVPTTE